jgi:hypothetical protein
MVMLRIKVVEKDEEEKKRRREEEAEEKEIYLMPHILFSQFLWFQRRRQNE